MTLGMEKEKLCRWEAVQHLVPQIERARILLLQCVLEKATIQQQP